MKNSLEFVVDTLLDLFSNPDTGYIAMRRSRVADGNDSAWLEYARSWVGDNKDLTAVKIAAIKTLMEKVSVEMRSPVSISKKVSTAAATSEDDDPEFMMLINRIKLLGEYVNTAQSTIKMERDLKGKAPAVADSLLEVWNNSLDWLSADGITELLYLVLSYESESNESPLEGLKKRRHELENSFVSEVFKVTFAVKMDDLLHKGREYTGYIRMVPDYVAEELLNELPAAINSLHEYFMTSPNPMSRTQKLLESIRSLQHVSTECFTKMEQTRYSLLPDRAALYLPSQTPSLVVSNPNPFLLSTAAKFEKFFIDVKSLEQAQKNKESELKASSLRANMG